MAGMAASNGPTVRDLPALLSASGWPSRRAGEAGDDDAFVLPSRARRAQHERTRWSPKVVVSSRVPFTLEENWGSPLATQHATEERITDRWISKRGVRSAYF